MSSFKLVCVQQDHLDFCFELELALVIADAVIGQGLCHPATLGACGAGNKDLAARREISGQALARNT